MTSFTRMPAVVKSGPGEAGVVLKEVERPAAAPGMVVLEVLAAGICGTDVHIARDEYAHEAPVVMGHEILGRVAETGAGVDPHWQDARVAVETYFSTCGGCDWCRDGRRNLCPRRRSLGSFEDGGLAGLVQVPVQNLHRVPDTLDGLQGVLAEPLACVCQCLLDPPVVSPGDQVLVTGPGTMGQLAAQVAVTQGGKVTLAGLPRDAGRLAAAAALGIATLTSAPEPEAYDVVIECSGAAPAAASALAAARRGGRYVQVGIFGKDVTLPFDQVLYKELTLSSGFASTAASWRRAIRLLSDGALSLEPLVTSVLPLADWEQAFRQAAAGEGIKTVLVP